MRLLLPFILTLLLLPACGGKSTGAGDPGSTPDGAESAEALFEILNDAAAKDDHAAAIPYIVPEQRGMMTFFLGVFAPVMMLEFGAAFAQEGSPEKAKIEEQKKSFGALLAKHGLDPDTRQLMEPLQSDEAREDPQAGFAKLDEIFKDVDHGALIRDALAWMEAHSDKEKKKDGKNKGPELKSLIDLKVDGDTATAKVEPSEEDKAKGNPEVVVDFVARDGRWYVDFSELILKGR